MSALDRAFAAALDPAAPPLLSKILAAARQGHLCLRSEEPPTFSSKAIVHENGRYYLQRNWVLETTIVEELSRLSGESPDDLFDSARFTLPNTLSPEQMQAAQSVLANALTVVSGGPGTGKSFLAVEALMALSRALRRGTFRVQIAAPTGKAADRLAAALPPLENALVETQTLHRLLNLQPGRMRLFERRTIDADLIIVDEASMIDASLFAHLLQAIPSGSRLLLLGDADQLPPVDGAGIFADLPAIRLKRNHRMQNSRLHAYFEAARTGDIAPLIEILEPLPQDLHAWIETELQPSRTFEHTRLISPLRKGPFGVDAINARIMASNPSRAPLLVTSNDPVQKLYNGTPGILTSNEVHFADGRVLPLRQLPGYEFAFALSAHKSQGSEFERIVCLLSPGSEEFGRAALYTALTRAKKEIRLVGSRETLEAMAAKQIRCENGLKERQSLIRAEKEMSLLGQ